MNLIAYSTKNPYNVINKELTQISTYEIKIKKESSIINPVIMIESDSFIDFNYCYIDNFNRYYFVNDVEVFPNNIFYLTLSIDVLESFKSDILASYGYIAKQTNYNSFYNSNYASEITKTNWVYTSNITLPDTTTNVLVTIGGI